MMDAYGALLERVLVPVWEGAVRHRPTLARLRQLEQTQWRSRDELLAIQAGALRALVRHAYECVPLYRRRFERAGVSPPDIHGPEDLALLPPLTRDEARDTLAERTSSAPPLPSIRKTTSGTLGRPLVFGYDPASEVWRNATRMRGYAWAGYTAGVRSLHFWGRTEPAALQPWRRAKVAVDRALRRQHFVDCTPGGDDWLAHVVDEIRRTRPEVILTYARAGAALARYVTREGLRDWETIPVICGAERLLDADRLALVEAFGPRVFETYGCREHMLIASECEAHDGLHVSMENLIVEILVRDAGGERPARPGEVGEVAITDLHNLGMPFIRYLNGDLAMAREHAPCRCGRGLERIGPIEGRVTETLRDGRGNRVSGLVFNLIFCDLADSTRQFQAVQHGDGAITLQIVPSERMSEQAVERLRAHCAAYLPDTPVRIALVERIPAASSGKRRVVVVEPKKASTTDVRST